MIHHDVLVSNLDEYLDLHTHENTFSEKTSGEQERHEAR